jgi:hypothetical protein
MKTSRARLLVASWDESLLRSRTMMLGAYFSVQPAGRFLEAVQLARNNSYDLLILCHTLDGSEQAALAAIAHETYPPAEVLVLETCPATDKPYADHVYEIARSPWRLLTTCAQIVGYKTRSKARHVAAG